jgi:hypothetical protein
MQKITLADAIRANAGNKDHIKKPAAVEKALRDLIKAAPQADKDKLNAAIRACGNWKIGSESYVHAMRSGLR